MICERRYPRFYYPKGIAGFWSGHVNGPFCDYTNNFKSKGSKEFLNLLDIKKFENDIESMTNLFKCTKDQVLKWAYEIADENIDETDDYYEQKYGGLPEKKDEEDREYDRKFAFQTKELNFF